MSDGKGAPTWGEVLLTGAVAFAVAFAGILAAFALWLQDLSAPQVALLGSGDALSVLVTDGPARLLLATGEDRIGFENALARVRPIFARRIDLLLLAGSGPSLLAPLGIKGDPHVRTVATLAPLPASPEAKALGPVDSLPTPRRIQLGPSVSVTVETALPYAADAATTFPAWRATIERGETRVVVLSDGDAADLFEPVASTSVLVVSGNDPLSAWEAARAVALVTNANAAEGPELRAAAGPAPTVAGWGFRVFPGEALQLRFTADGIAVPSEPANALAGTPPAQRASPPVPEAALRRRGRLSPAGTPL